MQEPAAEPRAGVDEQVRELAPCSSAIRTTRSTAFAGTRGRATRAMLSAFFVQELAHTLHPMQRSEIDVRREGAPALSSRRRGTIAIAATGHARAHREQPAQASSPARLEAARVHCRELRAGRRPAAACSSSHSSCTRTWGRLMTLSASCTRPRAWSSARMRSASSRDRPAGAAAHDELGAAVQGQQISIERRTPCRGARPVAAEAERDRPRARLPDHRYRALPVEDVRQQARPRWRPRARARAQPSCRARTPRSRTPGRGRGRWSASAIRFFDVVGPHERVLEESPTTGGESR